MNKFNIEPGAKGVLADDDDEPDGNALKIHIHGEVVGELRELYLGKRISILQKLSLFYGKRGR